ncbi:MAG: hypothetical protein H6558_18460 [Lewinellaceae bacterium]|nr:hypothetical protein [Lewinellaceae bacterium]
MRITNQFAAWFYLSTIILGVVVATLQVFFDIRGLLMDPPDVAVYASSPDLQTLARKEWREYENRFGDNDRLSVKKITEETSVVEALSNKNTLVLMSKMPDASMIADLQKKGLKVDSFRFLSAKRALPGEVFLLAPEKKSPAVRNFSDFLKSATAQDIAWEHLNKRKGRLS